MSRRFVLVALAAFLCCAVCAPPARALCKNPRLIGFQASIYTPGYPLGSGYMDSTIGPGFRGGFWALGAGDPRFGLGVDSGTWEALSDGWVYAQPGYPAGGTRSGVSLTWAGSPEIDGCVDFVPGDRCMALLLMDQNPTGGQFWLGTDAPDNLLNYDLAPEGGSSAVDLVPIPALVVLDQTPNPRVFTGPRLDQIAAGLDLEAGCAHDLVVGFRTYRWFGSPPTDFTRDDGVFGAGWELHPDSVGPAGEPAPLGGTVDLEAFCPTGSAVYYAVALVFESGFESAYLSAPTSSIACTCSEDADGDGFCGDPGSELRDCDDTDAAVYPGAPQVCDDVNNDCLDPAWPAMPDHEMDADGDGFSICGGDCRRRRSFGLPRRPGGLRRPEQRLRCPRLAQPSARRRRHRRRRLRAL